MQNFKKQNKKATFFLLGSYISFYKKGEERNSPNFNTVLA